VGEHRLDEQRVAAGVAPDAGDEGPLGVRVERVAGDRLDQRPGAVGRQAGQLDLVDGGRAPPGPPPGRQVAPRSLTLAVVLTPAGTLARAGARARAGRVAVERRAQREEEQQPLVAHPLDDVGEQAQRRGVGPLDVVDDEQHRLVRRQLAEPRPHRVPHGRPLGERGDAGGVAERRQAPGRLGPHQAGQQRGQVAGPRPQPVPLPPLLGDELVERLGDRLVGPVPVGRAPPVEHDRPVLVSAHRRLPDQARLADPGLAGDEDGAGPAGLGLPPAGHDLVEQRVPGHERGAGLVAQRRAEVAQPAVVRAPADLDHLDAVGEALERPGPEAADVVVEPAAAQLDHRAGAQDLVGLGQRLQPGDLDRGPPVEVAVAERHVADADAHPDVERPAVAPPAVLAVDGRLHLSAGPHRRRRRVERGQEPVAQRLHQPAVVGVDHRPQRAQVRAEHRRGVVVAQPQRERRGVDDVGPHQRHQPEVAARVHPHPPGYPPPPGRDRRTWASG
jgi:hypothetical protein